VTAPKRSSGKVGARKPYKGVSKPLVVTWPELKSTLSPTSPGDSAKVSTVTVTLASGAIATVRRGSGRDLLAASRLVDTEKDGPMAIVLAQMALCTVVNGKQATFKQVASSKFKDAWELLEIWGMLNRSHPRQPCPSCAGTGVESRLVIGERRDLPSGKPFNRPKGSCPSVAARPSHTGTSKRQGKPGTRRRAQVSATSALPRSRF
jgi:hypothetical protein